jgi:hypothetical protein
MGTSKNTLTIKKYWNSGGDLETEVLSFVVQERVKDGMRTVRLTVARKPDKHSNRLNMFAQLRSRGLGFSEVVLTRDTYSDGGQFVSRVMYVFPQVAVEGYFWRGDHEEITFVGGSFSRMSISKAGVTFQ